MPVAIRDLRFRRRVRTLEPDELETQRNDITFIICFFFFFYWQTVMIILALSCIRHDRDTEKLFEPRNALQRIRTQ